MDYNFDLHNDDMEMYEILDYRDNVQTPEEIALTRKTYDKPKIDTNSKEFKIVSKQNNVKLHDKPSAVHKGHRMRMYGKYLDSLFYDFSPHEVLEMILFNCYPQGNTNHIAINLINYFGCIENVFRADIDELRLAGLSERSAIVISQYKELIKYLHFIQKPDNIYLRTSQLAGEYCALRFGYDANEALHVLCINNKSKVVYSRVISTGDENSTSSYPIKVLRAAMISRTSNVILCHNHPDGSLEPSNEDIVNTGRIESILNAAGYRLVDHIICYHNRFTSFSERGLLKL